MLGMTELDITVRIFLYSYEVINFRMNTEIVLFKKCRVKYSEDFHIGNSYTEIFSSFKYLGGKLIRNST